MPHLQNNDNFFQKKGSSILKWPGNSPDINPSKYLKSIINQAKSHEIDHSTNVLLLRAVIQVWYQNSELNNMCSYLVNLISKRVCMVKKQKDGIFNIKLIYF